MATFLLSVMGAFEFERAPLSGNDNVKGSPWLKRPGSIKGRGKALNALQAADLVRRAAAGEANAALAGEFGVSPP